MYLGPKSFPGRTLPEKPINLPLEFLIGNITLLKNFSLKAKPFLVKRPDESRSCSENDPDFFKNVINPPFPGAYPSAKFLILSSVYLLSPVRYLKATMFSFFFNARK